MNSPHYTNGKFYDADQERRLVGALSVAPELIWPAVSHLRPADFGLVAAREAWGRLADTIRRGDGVDPGLFVEFHDAFNPMPLLPSVARAAAELIGHLSLLRNGVEWGERLTRAAHEHDIETVRRLLDSAPEIGRGMAADTLHSAREVASEVWDIFADPEALARHIKPLGLAPVDVALGGGLEAGTLTMLEARPGMGKTALLVQAGDAISERGDVAVIFSKEMTRHQWLARQAGRRARVCLQEFRRGEASESDRTRLLLETAKLGDCKTLLIDDSTPQTVADVHDLCDRVRKEHGRVDFVLIDHLRLFSDKADNETHRLGEISWGFKQLAKRISTRVLCAVQLSRGVEGKQDRRPDLSDMRDSGMIEENADTVLALYRERYYDPKASQVAEIIVRKDRNGERNAVAKMIFVERFMSLEKADWNVAPAG